LKHREHGETKNEENTERTFSASTILNLSVFSFSSVLSVFPGLPCFKQGLGSAFDTGLRDAWTEAYTVLAKTMQAAALDDAEKAALA